MNSPVRDVAGPVLARFLEMETAFQALARLRQEAHAHHAVYFYVTDANERLVGVVPARRLLFAETTALVGEIMVHPVVSVMDGQNFGTALALMAEQRLLALPVVDEEDRLIGVVDVSGFTQTICHLERREVAEDVFQIAGVRLQSEGSNLPRREQGSSLFWTSLAAVVLTPLLVSSFHQILSKKIAVTFFIPLIVMLAQGMALRAVTRSLWDLHVLRRGGGSMFDALRAELQLAGAFAAAAGLQVALFLNDLGLALAVACSVLAAGASAALLGHAIPRLLRSWHLNARIAAGPAVLALAAVASLSCYLAFSIAILD